MSEIPTDLKYTKNHEWIRRDGEDTYTIGITEHAQEQLGDVVFVELPDTDVEVSASDDVAVVESVKTAADVYTPLSGKIIEVNDILTGAPEKINLEPYGDGWIFRVQICDPGELDDLMNATEYAELENEE